MNRARAFALCLAAALVAGGAAAAVLLPPDLLRRSALTLVVQESQQVRGAAFFAAGDRYATVELPEDLFPSPPVVTASSARAPVAHAIGDLRRTGFRIELDQRASTSVVFLWQAAWDRLVEAAYVEEIAGMPEAITFDWGDRRLRALYTGYEDHWPTELAVPDLTLQEIGEARATFQRAVLEAARSDYTKRRFCTVVDRARRKLGLRVLDCPGRETRESQRSWEAIDSEAWTLVDVPSGVRLFRPPPDPAPRLEEVVELWSELFRATKAVDVSTHNNQLLDFMEEMSETQPSGGWTLVRFDTHSDLYLAADPDQYQPAEEIADFLNVAIAEERIEEIFWVLPDWSRSASMRGAFWNTELPLARLEGGAPYLAGPATLDVFLHRGTDRLYFGAPPEDVAPEAVRRIRVHKLVLEELPDLAGRDHVLLEVDADYFSNSGIDTVRAAAWNPSRERLLEAMRAVAAKLRASGVRAELAYSCLSPEYVGPEDQGEIFSVFAAAMGQSRKSDRLIGYRHNDVSGHTAGANTRARAGAVGELLWELQRLDAAHWPADLQIATAEGAEQRAALELLRRAGPFEGHTPNALLHRLDRFDGERDARIRIPDLETTSSLEDPAWILSARTRLP